MKGMGPATLLGLLALAGSGPVPAAPIPPHLITVRNLFTEVIPGLDERLAVGHWEVSGTQPLVQWPQGDPPAKAAGLVACDRNGTFLPVQVLTSKPVRLTQDADSLTFFQGVPVGQAPRDGSWIGFKYVFHPNAVVTSHELDGPAGEPIAFYLLRPAPPDLTEADLEPPLPPRRARSLVLKERHAYDDLAASHAMARPFLGNRERRLLRAAADAGLVQAQYRDGMLEFGSGNPEALAKARQRFHEAARQGLDLAQGALAVMLKHGMGGPVDLPEARVQFQLAAAQGFAGAQYALAIMLQGGEGGPVDLANARAQYQLAAAQGRSEAQFNLANMLRRGEGGPVDLAGARANFQRAADQGDRRALAALEALAAVEALAAMDAKPVGNSRKRPRE